MLNKTIIIMGLLFMFEGVAAMKLTSTAFKDGDYIPTKYTCDGANISPPIAWKEAPSSTKSFALIYDDPDAPSGTWDHWVLYNLPPETVSLPENATTLPQGTRVGLNSWPKAEYGGPCPPTGTHRYIFHLYALDTMLDLPEGATSEALRKKMEKHILATATLTGRYQRTK
jgi:hypothetical protein